VRISYSDEEDYPGQFGLWQANCERSLRGKEGQKELLELREALLSLPEKRLIYGELEDEDGSVCAIAAYGKRKGLDLSRFDVDSDSDEVGIAGGMPKLVAWKVVEVNDLQLDHVTPEERYVRMLAWIDSRLVPSK
jgi:hypothetical protein